MDRPRKRRRDLSSPPQDSNVIHVPVPYKAARKPKAVDEEKQRAQLLQIRKYKRERLQFQLSTKSLLILSRIVTDRCILQKYRAQPLLKKVTEASQEMMMDELELIVWSLYLDRFVWKNPAGTLKYMLYITAYAVKTYLNELEEVFIFQEYLGDKLPGFNHLYNTWIYNARHTLGILPLELNTKFKQLYKPVLTQNDRKIIDYNYYVDQILDSAPPYQTANKQKIEDSSISVQDSVFNSVVLDARSADSNEEDDKSAPPLALSMLRQEGNELQLFSRMNSAFLSSGVEESFISKPGTLGLDSSQEGEELPVLKQENSLFSQYFNSQ